MERELVMLARYGNETLIVSILILGLFILYYAFPPYVVPMFVSYSVGLGYTAYAAFRYYKHESNAGDNGLEKLFLRLFLTIVMMLIEMIRNAEG